MEFNKRDKQLARADYTHTVWHLVRSADLCRWKRPLGGCRAPNWIAFHLIGLLSTKWTQHTDFGILPHGHIWPSFNPIAANQTFGRCTHFLSSPASGGSGRKLLALPWMQRSIKVLSNSMIFHPIGRLFVRLRRWKNFVSAGLNSQRNKLSTGCRRTGLDNKNSRRYVDTVTRPSAIIESLKWMSSETFPSSHLRGSLNDQLFTFRF